MTHPCLRLAAVLLVSGCASTHPQAPILLDDGAGAALAGVWEGTYESRDTGRVGDVYFALSADGTSAVGEVVMVPRGTSVGVRRDDGGGWRWDGAVRPSVLTIRFVHLRGGASGGEVVGELDPYRDPDCECELRTTFRGTVDGDVVMGTFESATEDAAHDAEGTWHAIRQRER